MIFDGSQTQVQFVDDLSDDLTGADGHKIQTLARITVKPVFFIIQTTRNIIGNQPRKIESVRENTRSFRVFGGSLRRKHRKPNAAARKSKRKGSVGNDDAANEILYLKKGFIMSEKNKSNARLGAKVEIEFPDFAELPARVREKYEGLPTVVNFFRMLGYSPGSFVEIIDLTNAIFKNLTLSDYHKELLVVQTAAETGSDYEWEQHVSIAQAAGGREEQFVAIAENRLDDAEIFSEKERVLLRFGKTIHEKGKALGVIFKHALEHFSVEELADAMIVIGFYRMLSIYIQTFDLPIDAQADGNWVKG